MSKGGVAAGEDLVLRLLARAISAELWREVEQADPRPLERDRGALHGHTRSGTGRRIARKRGSRETRRYSRLHKIAEV